jgi:hypothetical protein
MVLDVVEENSGRFLIWGAGAAGESVLLCVADFEPYFYVAAPRDQVSAPVVYQTPPGPHVNVVCHSVLSVSCVGSTAQQQALKVVQSWTAHGSVIRTLLFEGMHL